MDAVSNKTYTVYFGGSYVENWSEDYSLSVTYDGRRAVQARFLDGRWTPVGGDEELVIELLSPDCDKLKRQYFETAATVYAATHICLQKGLKLERLDESFQSTGDPIAAPELLRLLMDDCGFSLEEAYRVTANCCDDLSCRRLSPQMLLPLQPRTAHVLSVLRRTVETTPALIHDSRSAKYRQPFGAVPAGSELRLAFSRRGGRIRHAELVLWGDSCEHSFSMERDGDLFYADVVLPAREQALWYAFYVETPNSALWLCPDKRGFAG